METLAKMRLKIPQHQTQQEAETRAKAISPTSLPKRVFGNAPFPGAEDRLYCCIS
ncbi:hypothetical protein SMU21_07075 [Streptococcus mutans 1SM1]|nr:hypothetical protein SMU21_07075 [Streptococcus mutans 1SM1]EMB65424.1 hypothetical protein SMU22_03309 [Streptococcus mutans 4SM1]EMC49061.1 hypothetical protein SMU103_03765 [Streptococcus mutans SA38]